MRRTALPLCALVLLSLQPAGAQAPAPAAAPPVPAKPVTSPSKLPVRRVILYKSGVGYFEHVGRVHGNESVTIDFNSSQLNDVLASLTTLDLGGGRIAGVSYTSEAPLAQRLGALRLPVGEHATLTQLLDALRGSRLEVRSGAGAAFAGRLLGVERRTSERGDQTIDRDEMTLVSDAGDVRVVEITPAVTVRLAERDTTEQVGAYLGLLASARAQDRRRMSIATAGGGDRDLLVSYVSEVPIWKTTYRIVLPTKTGGKPLLQGWAIVDNTIGEDWRNVELSLVAGAPQSFIQQISQPLYTQRPVVPLPQTLLTAPQTHGATLTEREPETAAGMKESLMIAPQAPRRGAVGGIVMAAPAPPPSSAAIAAKMIDVAPAAEGRELGDLFEYRVSEPITIARDQSALVPILRSEVTADRVSLWTSRQTGGRPFRSLWLTNASGLTLDGGSFTILDAGAFAGEGLIDPLKPGEKRLLSYAVDLGVQVEPQNGDEQRTVRRITIARGVLTEHGEQLSRRVYTIRDSDASDRQVVIEHPIRGGWKLAEGTRPVETSADAYRFSIPVAAGKTETLTVTERRDLGTTYRVTDLNDQQLTVIVRDSGNSDAVRQALAPVLSKKAALAKLDADLAARSAELERIKSDQERVRENMKALKGSSEEQQLVKRYAAQLNQQEDRVDAIRREIDDLQQKRHAADAELAAAIDALALDVAVGGR